MLPCPAHFGEATGSDRKPLESGRDLNEEIGQQTAELHEVLTERGR